MRGVYRLKKMRDALIRLARRAGVTAFDPKDELRDLLQNEAGAWNRAREEARGPKVLIATTTGGHGAVTPVEALAGVALTLRGAQVHYLLCDGILPACLQAAFNDFDGAKEFAADGPQKKICGLCVSAGKRALGPLGLPVHKLGDNVTPAEIAEVERLEKSLSPAQMQSYKLDGLAVGEHASAGALRFFARGTLEGEPEGEAVLRRYFRASMLTALATRRLFGKIKFESSVFNHGIYVPHGVIGETAREAGVRVVNWSPAYRKKCFIFSHGDTYHHTLMNEPVSNWENMRWDAARDAELGEYLKSRWHGTKDWIWFHEKPELDEKAILAGLGIDPSKPRIGMLTNVIWDAQLHYPANAFPNMRDWIVRTIAYFAERPELQLVIRVHPAEIRGTTPSRQLVVDEINKAFPQPPKNVFVIGPESRTSTYAVMQGCDTVLIYGTKTGVELTSVGVPVIVAGEAWIRGKGLTQDAASAEHYFRLLDALPSRRALPESQVVRARKYAYHFFFRRMIPVRSLEPKKGWPPYALAVSSLGSLAAGADPGLDTICDGILKGREFVHGPYEQEIAAAAGAAEGARA